MEDYALLLAKHNMLHNLNIELNHRYAQLKKKYDLLLKGQQWITYQPYTRTG